MNVKTKKIAIATGVGVCLWFLVQFVWNIGVSIDHWQRSKEPLICVKSRTVTGSGTTFVNGNVGVTTMTYDVCVKEAPNPYYKGKQ